MRTYATDEDRDRWLGDEIGGRGGEIGGNGGKSWIVIRGRKKETRVLTR